jgi:hypothetical protein
MVQPVLINSEKSQISKAGLKALAEKKAGKTKEINDVESYFNGL